MKCHYEVLGVNIDSSPEDLKKAYRKLALEWHPDKNLDRLEEAKEAFQLIQQAYEVLIDPQERAWYDRHRDDILRGDAEDAFKDDCLNVYQYFNTSCFKGYNDDEKGFYTIYRQVFEKIAAEDKPFIDDDEDFEVPNFGYSYSSYDEVVHEFYGYWQSYCTSKSYSWVDKFNLNEARKSGMGRQMIRIMDKENKKLRDQHKKRRNEEVRELVAFVRKRDRRVQMHKKLVEEQKAEKAKRSEELRRKQVQERNKTLENYRETEWSSMSQFEGHFSEIESNLDVTFGSTSADKIENDENLESEALYCIACEKDFRSHKAMENHENSKKHKENVALLKTLMEEEEEEILEATNTDEKNDNIHDDEQLRDSNGENISSEALLNELIKSSTKTKKKKRKSKLSVLEEDQNVFQDLVDVEGKIADIQIANDSNVTDNTCDNALNSSAESVPVKKQSKKSKVTKNAIATSNQNEEKAEKQTTICEMCNRNFGSRNKLFDHLKESGHAVYKNDNAGSRSSSSGKKQRKKKL